MRTFIHKNRVPLLLMGFMLMAWSLGLISMSHLSGWAALGLFGTVSFNTIPANLRVPLFYAEMDNTQASYFSQNQRTLLIGQRLATGSALNNTAIIVSTTDQAKAFFGRGSMLARMHYQYRLTDLVGEVWCIALADNAAGVAATSTVTLTGPSTQAGTIALYIAGQLVSVPVANGDTAAIIATSMAAAINANVDLPVTAAAVAAVVTLTCRWKGLSGNDIQVADSYRGAPGGEILPAGVTIAYAAGVAGTTNPVLDPAIVAMGDDEYDYVLHPYNDSTSMDRLATEYNESAGRWSYARQVYGHVYCALRGTLSALVTAGNLRNDQHATLAAIDVDTQAPVWEYVASYGARNAVFLNVDPARPTQSGALDGIMPPRAGKRFLLSERQSLLNAGIATSYVNAGVVRIERAITTYQKNTQNQPDTSYLDSETLHTSAYVIRYLRQRITSKYGRMKLANDGTRFGAGAAIVTPSVIRGELIAAYSDLELLGIVENSALFAKYLIVERNAINPNRLDVLLPPDYVNQLRIFALLNQFRLQYAATA